MNTKNLKKIIIAAMFSAVIAVATMIRRIPSPTGYVNFGDCFVLIAGWLLENIDYKTLFPYATIFVFASFITMSFVKHGDNKIEAKKGIEAFDVED